MAPPACCSASVSPRCGRACRWRCGPARARRDRARAQPMTWRPAGPLRSGLRRVRQATKQSSSGTNQPSSPTEPFDDGAGGVADAAGQLPPHRGGDHDGEADEEQAGPSRRCSGSSSRAVWPIRRTPAPKTWAMPEPERRQRAPEGSEEPVHRARPVADRPRGGALRLRRAPLRGGRCDGTGCRTTGIVKLPEPALAVRLRCFATPAGKTYGSPWCEARRLSHQSQVSHAVRSLVIGRDRSESGVSPG